MYRAAKLKCLLQTERIKDYLLITHNSSGTQWLDYCLGVQTKFKVGKNQDKVGLDALKWAPKLAVLAGFDYVCIIWYIPLNNPRTYLHRILSPQSFVPQTQNVQVAS